MSPTDASLCTDEHLASESATLATDVQCVWDKINALHEQRTALTTRYQELQDEIARRKVTKDGETPDWEYLLFEDGSVGRVRYDARSAAIESLGLSTMGYDPELKQSIIKVSVNSNGSNKEAVKKSINTILPFIKVTPKNKFYEAHKRFSLMEDTLSEYGVYSLMYFPATTQWGVARCRYHREEEAIMFANLDIALNYIQKTHPYTSI